MWDPAARGGRGAFVPPAPVYDGLSSATRSAATAVPSAVGPVAPSVEDPAAAFDEKLSRGARDGGYLVLTVEGRLLADAEQALTARFGLPALSLEKLFLSAMKEVAREKEVPWKTVLGADTRPSHPNLRALVRAAVPRVEGEIRATDLPVLLTYPGLLVRYEQLDLLDRLRDRATRPDGGLKGAWLLVPSSDQQVSPALDGVALPVLTPNQWARIPTAWLDRAVGMERSVDDV